MHLLKEFYNQTVIYDLINRYHYKTIEQIPTITKIVLSFTIKESDLKSLSASLLALELITSQKSFIIGTKTSNVKLKIKRGVPIGCKVTLRKKAQSEFFLRSIFNILPNLHDFQGFHTKRSLEKNEFSYEIHDTFTFKELERKYYLFGKLPKLNLTIVTNCQKKGEALFLLKSHQFPVFSI